MNQQVVAASAARTASGNSGAFTLTEGNQNLSVLVDVTVVSGTTPSMTISVEWSDDSGTTFAQADPADAMTALTTTGTKAKIFQVKAPWFRVVWTITGTTPSFTFSVRTADA